MLRYVSTQLTKLPGDLSNIWANVRRDNCRLRGDRETETHRRMNKRDENTRRDQHHSWISRHIPDGHPTHTSPMDTPTIHQHSIHFPLNESTVQWQATSRNRWSAICHRMWEVGDDHLTILVHMHCKPDQSGTFTEPCAWWLIFWTSDVNQKSAQAKVNSTEKVLTGVYVVLVVNDATRFQSHLMRPWVNTQQIGHTAPQICQHCQHITCLTIYQRENTTKNWETTTENGHIPPTRPQITRFAVDRSSIRCGKTTTSDEEIMFAEGCRVRVQTIGVA